MIDPIIALFFPEHCQRCGRRGKTLCEKCACSIPVADAIEEPGYAFALYDYSDPLVRRAIWELKYHRKSSLAKALVHYGRENLTEYIASVLQSPSPTKLILVPVPQHYRKTLIRGFNQSVVIAKWLRSALPGSTISQLIKKISVTIPQAHTRNRTQRKKNVHHTMKVSRPGKIEKHALYIIVDDVITTGSTVSETGRALRAAGAKHIIAIAIAHGYAHH